MKNNKGANKIEEQEEIKFWHSNRAVYERYFGLKQYQKLIQERKFEQMRKTVEEMLRFSE